MHFGELVGFLIAYLALPWVQFDQVYLVAHHHDRYVFSCIGPECFYPLPYVLEAGFLGDVIGNNSSDGPSVVTTLIIKLVRLSDCLLSFLSGCVPYLCLDYSSVFQLYIFGGEFHSYSRELVFGQLSFDEA